MPTFQEKGSWMNARKEHASSFWSAELQSVFENMDAAQFCTCGPYMGSMVYTLQLVTSYIVLAHKLQTTYNHARFNNISDRAMSSLCTLNFCMCFCGGMARLLHCFHAASSVLTIKSGYWVCALQKMQIFWKKKRATSPHPPLGPARHAFVASHHRPLSLWPSCLGGREVGDNDVPCMAQGRVGLTFILEFSWISCFSSCCRPTL